MRNNEYQLSLMDAAVTKLSLPDADIEYYANFLAADVAWDTYRALLEGSDWRQENITVYGKSYPTPRLSSWVGDAGTDYRYSNMTMHPLPWTATLQVLREQVERASEHQYNSVLLNLYRDGQDSNGWHSDDEPELGVDPVIASLSLGGSRDFHLRHKTTGEKFSIALEHGSLLIMRGATQRCWQHHIPKRAKANSRINLTFRTILK